MYAFGDSITWDQDQEPTGDADIAITAQWVKANDSQRLRCFRIVVYAHSKPLLGFYAFRPENDLDAGTIEHLVLDRLADSITRISFLTTEE